MHFDLKQFRAQQQAGLASIHDTGTFSPDEDKLFYVVHMPVFDPATGQRVDDLVFGVYHRDLVAKRDALQAELDDLNALLEEVEAQAAPGKSIRDVKPAPVRTPGAEPAQEAKVNG